MKAENNITPLTRNQVEILKVAAKGNADGSAMNKHQMTDALPYETNYTLVIQSIKVMMRKGLLKKLTYEYRDVRYAITEYGMKELREHSPENPHLEVDEEKAEAALNEKFSEDFLTEPLNFDI